jgi:hypothetical protein
MPTNSEPDALGEKLRRLIIENRLDAMALQLIGSAEILGAVDSDISA